jgi:D-lactate dehydrogenase (cytochrome)
VTVVLACGEVLSLSRGECVADDCRFTIETKQGPIPVLLPAYTMPAVPKLSAGYFARPGMDLIDLFIGSEGTLGIITDVTFRLLAPAPAVALALVMCPDERDGLRLVEAIRTESQRTWRTGDPAGIDARRSSISIDGRCRSSRKTLRRRR